MGVMGVMGFKFLSNAQREYKLAGQLQASLFRGALQVPWPVISAGSLLELENYFFIPEGLLLWAKGEEQTQARTFLQDLEPCPRGGDRSQQ